MKTVEKKGVEVRVAQSNLKGVVLVSTALIAISLIFFTSVSTLYGNPSKPSENLFNNSQTVEFIF